MKTSLMKSLSVWMLALGIFSVSTMTGVQPAAALSPPPSLVARTVSSSQIALSWVDPNDGETSFAIERSLAPSSGFVKIGLVGRSTTTYQSNALASGTTYYYRVRALALESGSSYSNVASATTTPAGSDSTPPSVSLTSPASGTTYTTAQTVTLAALASDNTGVTRVEFYDGAALRCTATTPSYNCTWAFTNADNGTHVWTAKAYDAAGNSSASSAITLAVNIATAVAPAITMQPANATVTAPAPAIFSVGATGTAPLSYQWQKNGVNISGAMSASYTTPATSTADSGSTFRVVVSKSAGSVTSAAATLTVNAGTVAPTMTSAPANATVTAPATASFSASASGTAPLSYQWQKNSVNISGATSASYTTPATSTLDSGSSYRVVVTNSAGSVTSAPALLTVNVTAASVALSYNGKLRDKVGQNNGARLTDGQLDGTFTMTLGGGSGSRTVTQLELRNTAGGTWDTIPTSIYWTLGVGSGLDSPLSQNGSDAVNVTMAPGGSMTLFATDCCGGMFATGTTFTLTVMFSDGTSASAMTTVTTALPSITSQPSNVTVTTPASATFGVSASGTAPLSYQWQKNGVNISGAMSASFTTPATSTADSGSTFRVVVSNSAGSVTSNAATLTVNAAAVAPAITSQPVSQTVTAPATATFSVSATGTAPLSYQWQKNGANISGATSASYTTPVTSTADSGSTFRVVVTNSAGSVTSAAATLTVNAAPDSTPPSIPTGLSTSANTCGQITVSWNASTDTGGSGLKGYNVSRNGTFFKQVLAPATSLTDTGVIAATVYSYAVSAVDNASNQSVQSATASTNTPPCNLPPVANAGSDKTANTGTAVTLSGSGSFDPDGTINSYVWNFGDGISGSGVSVTHAYAAGGSYTVTLTVTDNLGASSSDTTAVTITSTPSTRGALLWVAALGSTNDDQGRGVTVDAQGNVLMTGHFRQTVDFGGGPLTAFRLEEVAAIPSDIFVAKYSATGVHLWSIRIGAHGDDSASSIAVDGNGDVFITGFVGPDVDFGSGIIPSFGSYDLFVAKYSGIDGRYLWARRFGASGDEYSYGIAVDGSGHVTVTGEFQGTVDFGGGPLSSAGDRDIFVAQYSGADGSHRWSKRLGGSLADVGLGIAVDSLDNVLVTGYFRDTVNFGSGTVTSAGDRDIFLAKYTSSGAHVWSKRLGGTGADTGWALAIDGTDNIVLTGGFVGTVDFGGGSLSTPNSMPDGFLAKYSSTGTHVWSKRFGSTSSDLGRAVAVDGTGDVTVTGLFAGTIDFGGGPLTSAGSFEIFVAKYSAAGGHLWARRFGGTGDERSQSVAAAPDGSVVVTGYFPGTVDFGRGPLTSAGSNDIFLFRLTP